MQNPTNGVLKRKCTSSASIHNHLDHLTTSAATELITSRPRDHQLWLTVSSTTMTMVTRSTPPPPQTDLKTVVESRNREWHFHIYFLIQSQAETAAALALRDAVLRLRRDGECHAGSSGPPPRQHQIQKARQTHSLTQFWSQGPLLLFRYSESTTTQ